MSFYQHENTLSRDRQSRTLTQDYFPGYCLKKYLLDKLDAFFYSERCVPFMNRKGTVIGYNYSDFSDLIVIHEDFSLGKLIENYGLLISKINCINDLD